MMTAHDILNAVLAGVVSLAASAGTVITIDTLTTSDEKRDARQTKEVVVLDVEPKTPQQKVDDLTAKVDEANREIELLLKEGAKPDAEGIRPKDGPNDSRGGDPGHR